MRYYILLLRKMFFFLNKYEYINNKNISYKHIRLQ